MSPTPKKPKLYSAYGKRSTAVAKAQHSRRAACKPMPKKIAMAPSYRTVRDILRRSNKGRSTIHGDSYHLRLAIMIILRAYRMHQLDREFRFTIAVEVAASGKFDDILYHYTSPREATTGTLFIQAKHKLKTDASHAPTKPNGGSTITERALLAAWNSKSAYSIPMYFVSFLEVGQRLPNESRYVLCTNAELDKNVESYFTPINTRQDNALLFCEDIGATCYQLARDNPFPKLIDTLRGACLAKLAKVLAASIFTKQILTLNDALVNTFYGFISATLVPVKQPANGSSVRTFKFTNDLPHTGQQSTLARKFQTAVRKEYETLVAKANHKRSKHSFHELVVKIDRRSFTAVQNQEAYVFANFDQKVREFGAKFVLVCNSSNEAALREKAIALLPGWCDAEPGTVFDKLQGILLDALKSEKLVPLDLPFVRQCFQGLDLNQNISRLRSFSEEYLRSVCLNHSHIEVDPKHLKRSSVHTFLQHKSACGVYQYNSLLDVTVSSYIYTQMLAHSNCETLFVDSATYQGREDMKIILQELLAYLKAGKFPAVKVITILGRSSQLSLKEMKELAKQYDQKIVLIDKASGTAVSQRAKPVEWFYGDNPKHAAWSRLFKECDLLIYGTVLSLGRMVEDSDDLNALLGLLELGKETDQLADHGYENIKSYYIHRYAVPYQVDWERTMSRFHTYTNPPKALSRTNRYYRNKRETEPDPPGIEGDDGAKVHILLNGSGHGKTYYLTWLAWRLADYDRSLLIIKFIGTDFERSEVSNIQHLNDTGTVRALYIYMHLALFEAEANRDDAVRCAKLLTVANGQIVLNKAMERDLSTVELIRLRLFREKFNQRKLVLILDGVDQIVPTARDAIVCCFARFARLDGIRSLYLSSRPDGFEDDLAKAFDRSVWYQLEPFSRDDVSLSWHKFLQSNISDYTLPFPPRYSSLLFGLCVRLHDTLNDVITVPLILRTVQTILFPQIKEHVNVVSDTKSSHVLARLALDKFSLVEAIVHTMEETFRADKIGTTHSSLLLPAAHRERIGSGSSQIQERHALLAMYAIFDEAHRDQLLSEQEKQSAVQLLHELMYGIGSTAFVVGVAQWKPIFVHFIFAELFAAHWFCKNRHRFRAESIFRSQAFWARPLKRLRYFFNCLLVSESEGCELHWAVLNGCSRQHFEAMLHDNPSAIAAKDKAGRLPIHLLQTDLVKLLLTQSNCIDEKDALFGWSALDYALVEYEVDVVEDLLSQGATVNVDTLLQQLCSNEPEVILQRGLYYVDLLQKEDHLADTVNKLCERVARHIISVKKDSIYVPRETLFSLSMLEYCVKLGAVLMFHHLITCSGSYDSSRGWFRRLMRVPYEWLRPERLSAGPAGQSADSPITRDGAIEQCFNQSLRENATTITNYLFEHSPTFLGKMKDIDLDTLVSCAKCTITANNVPLFRKIFHQLCIKLAIPHVEEKDIVDECGVACDDNHAFGAELPFGNVCCPHEVAFSHEYFKYSVYNEFHKEGFLAHALDVGSVPLLSYILQKTKTNVTNALIIVLMQWLSLFYVYSPNHSKSLTAFKYLLNKTLDLHIVDYRRRNLLQATFENGCLYMVPCLIDQGFVPDQIVRYQLVNLFRCSSEERITRLFTYLQQHVFMDVFLSYPSLGGTYIIDIAIQHKYVTFTKTLFEVKYGYYPKLHQQNAMIEMLERMRVTYDENAFLNLFNTWMVDEDAEYDDLKYVIWDEVVSSIAKQIPIV